MAFYDSSISIFQVNDGASLRDISAYITSISGLPGPRELNVATSIADTGEKYHPGLERVTIVLELMWSDDANTGPDTIFGPMRTATAVRAFDYGPEGKVTGDIKYSGSCWLRNFEITSRVGSMVLARVELPVDGVITRGTYT